jgi:hypothetical protein
VSFTAAYWNPCQQARSTCSSRFLGNLGVAGSSCSRLPQQLRW